MAGPEVAGPEVAGPEVAVKCTTYYFIKSNVFIAGAEGYIIKLIYMYIDRK